jgi:hypothetical protein
MHGVGEREGVWLVCDAVCQCNFNADTRVFISKDTFKKLQTKQSLAKPDRWPLELFCPAVKD